MGVITLAFVLLVILSVRRSYSASLDHVHTERRILKSMTVECTRGMLVGHSGVLLLHKTKKRKNV
eukprot:XP_001707021.1 Hypothetical protein GL50803_31556 [Giardia lamblia ATCC 50803]